MRKTKIFASFFCCLCIAFSAGCFSASTGGNGYNAPVTIIIQVASDNGVQLDWITDVVRGYENDNETTVYEDGRIGVDIKLDVVDKINVRQVPMFDVHMYIDDTGKYQDLSSLFKDESLIDLTDLVNEKYDERYDANGRPYKVSIAEKINPEYLPAITDKNGIIRALPCSGERQGLMYDENVFDSYGLYFADSEKATDHNSVPHQSKFGTARFVEGLRDGNQTQMIKSCGNDGVFGTDDDGLPTSLVEFFILCDYMKSRGIQPITYDASDVRNKENIYNAICATLSGKESYQTMYTFNGKTEIVLGFDRENAFEGINYVKKPRTQTITITEENGYLANSNVNRYWGMSVMKIIENEGWYSSISKPDKDLQTTVREFLMNGTRVENQTIPPCGMLLTTDRWYSVCNKSGVIEEAEKYVQSFYSQGLSIKWMSTPTNVWGTVKPTANGKPNPVFSHQSAGGNLFLNARLEKDKVEMRVCKELIKSMYSDAKLSYYTATQGYFKNGLEYDVNESDYYESGKYQKSLINSFSNSNKVMPVITNLYNQDVDYYYDYKNGIEDHLGLLISKNVMSLQAMFEYSTTTPAEWEIFKSGNRLEYNRPDEEEGGVSDGVS